VTWITVTYVSTAREPDLTAKLGEYGPQFMSASVRGKRARLDTLHLSFRSTR